MCNLFKQRQMENLNDDDFFSFYKTQTVDHVTETTNAI